MGMCWKKEAYNKPHVIVYHFPVIFGGIEVRRLEHGMWIGKKKRKRLDKEKGDWRLWSQFVH